jgi:tetratricopeptide (TPR) repeat protein
VNGETVTKHGECLSEEMISNYLQGDLAPVEKGACEVHLAACDRCREELAQFMRLLRSEISSEENAILANVLEQWDQRKLQPVPPKSRSLTAKGWSLVAAGAVAAIIALGFLTGIFPSASPASAGEVIAALFANDRPFEARLAAQPYRSITITRGPEADQQYGLLEQEMTDRAANAYQMGLLFMFQKDYTRAARFLETAAADPNAPPAVHNDLGVAYLQQGDTLNLDKAETELRRALELESAFGPAVFNLSILYERKGAPEEAEKQRLRYLELDSKSGWAAEVSSKLSGKD